MDKPSLQRRFVEGDVIHADGAVADNRTLCGAVLEGDIQVDIPIMEETTASINCEACVAIIKHCKRIRLR